MINPVAIALKNTRTTMLSWWERLFIGPCGVNYHLEHHLLMTVPAYNLPKLHEMLEERGALDGALVDHGYWGVLKQASSKPESEPASPGSGVDIPWRASE